MQSKLFPDNTLLICLVFNTYGNVETNYLLSSENITMSCFRHTIIRIIIN